MSKYHVALTQTGLIVNVGNEQYLIHSNCLAATEAALEGIRVVVYGPLFANTSEWSCALNTCPEKGN